MSGNDEERSTEGGEHGLIGEMVSSPNRTERAGGLLLKESSATDEFSQRVTRTLQQTEAEVRGLGTVNALVAADQGASWTQARQIVEQFKPVPWFIWRLSNFVFGRTGSAPEITEGLVFGMRRLLFAAASDPVLGSGEKVNTVRAALQILSPDLIAAVSVVHAICRRLQSCQFERIWRPILDDAIVRCQIGLYLGQLGPSFGGGRGMLAGFSGRSGLAILIATGTLEQARTALEMLATGAEIEEVGVGLYQCNPLQVSAMLLSAAGCGRDAAFGTVGYAAEDPFKIVEGSDQLRWLAAYTVADNARMSKLDQVPEKFWQALKFETDQEKDDLANLVKILVRRGHGWSWIVA